MDGWWHVYVCATMFLEVTKQIGGSRPRQCGKRNVANECSNCARVTRVVLAVECAYLALFFVRISTCSWKSVIISLCFFFKSVAVSSDSRWTSSSSLRSFSSSASRLRLASNCQRELLVSLVYIDGIYIGYALTWCSAPPSASSRRSDICMTWTLRSAFSRSIWGEGEVDQIRHDSFSYFIIYNLYFSAIYIQLCTALMHRP